MHINKASFYFYLISLCSFAFFNTAFCLSGDGGYHLTIDFDDFEESACCKIAKDSRIISSLNIPTRKVERGREFCTMNLLQPAYFSFSSHYPNRYIIIDVHENGNHFTLQVSANGDIAFGEFAMRDSFLLTTNAAGLFMNNTVMQLEEDFSIHAPESKLVCCAGSRLKAKGEIILLVADSVIVETSIKSHKQVVIGQPRLSCDAFHCANEYGRIPQESILSASRTGLGTYLAADRKGGFSHILSAFGGKLDLLNRMIEEAKQSN